jgi:hypothetical protein
MRGTAAPGGHRWPPYRRRPPPGVLARRWLTVLVALGLLIAGVVFAIHRLAGSSPSPTAAATAPGSRAGTHGASSHPSASPINGAPTAAVSPSVTISVVGDTELGNTPLLPPDPATYLAPVRSALAAPIVFGNLEGTLTNAPGSKCSAGSSDCFAFRTPPGYAQYLRNDGFTVLNSANNHSHDAGTQGVLDTSAALRAAGIVQTGLLGQIGLVHVGGTSVAFVAFAPYHDTNNLLDLATARTLIEQARRQAAIVVVYMHAGAEGSQADHVTGSEETYLGEDRGNPKAFAHAAIDDGADLVVASGPHVLRGVEFYRSHLIAYSLGNFAGFHNFASAGNLRLSGILKVTLDGHGSYLKATFVSTVLDAEGRPALDPSGAAGQWVSQLSEEDFAAEAASVGPSGAITPRPAAP